MFGPGAARRNGQPSAPASPATDLVRVLPREGVNVRAAPGLDAAKVTALPLGTILQSTGRAAVEGGIKWIEVSLPGSGAARTGWVAETSLGGQPTEGP